MACATLVQLLIFLLWARTWTCKESKLIWLLIRLLNRQKNVLAEFIQIIASTRDVTSFLLLACFLRIINITHEPILLPLYALLCFSCMSVTTLSATLCFIRSRNICDSNINSVLCLFFPWGLTRCRNRLTRFEPLALSAPWGGGLECHNPSVICIYRTVKGFVVYNMYHDLDRSTLAFLVRLRM